MYERAGQALAKQALEPEWEARFEATSYGFRPGRGCHDAIQAIFDEIKQKAKFVLDADIKGCFDHISHPALLNKLATYPAMRRAIRAWLKAGVMEAGVFEPTEAGTPQGGVLSPVLANIALHGMEAAVQKAYRRKEGIPSIIGYADDFVILHPTREGVEKARQLVEQWLGGIGLELKREKTRVVQTLHSLEGQPAGFEFLGMLVRQYTVGKSHTARNPHGESLGFKTLIKPSKTAIKRQVRELERVVDQHQMMSQEPLIGKLNPIVSGWCTYYRTVVAKDSSSSCDNWFYSKLRRWAQRRHPNKTAGWVSRK
jgi:RNA-directed DNA polymerase